VRQPASIAVIQISREILSICRKYYSGIKNAEKDIKGLCNEITALRSVLQKVKELLSDPKATKLRGLTLLAEQLERCSCELEELKNRINPGHTRKAAGRLGLRALKWPFAREEVEQKITKLNRYKETFSLALSADQT